MNKQAIRVRGMKKLLQVLLHDRALKLLKTPSSIKTDPVFFSIFINHSFRCILLAPIQQRLVFQRPIILRILLPDQKPNLEPIPLAQTPHNPRRPFHTFHHAPQLCRKLAAMLFDPPPMHGERLAQPSQMELQMRTPPTAHLLANPAQQTGEVRMWESADEERDRGVGHGLVDAAEEGGDAEAEGHEEGTEVIWFGGGEEGGNGLRSYAEVEVDGVEVQLGRGVVKRVDEETFGRGSAEGAAGGRELEGRAADFGAFLRAGCGVFDAAAGAREGLVDAVV